MGTRGLIATVEHEGLFLGRYTHWDSYPTARVPQLLQTYRELAEDWQAVRDYAIRPSQQGYWSSYTPPVANAANNRKRKKVTCWLCGGTGERTDMVVANGCNACGGTGKADNRERRSTWVKEREQGLTRSDEDCGAEWAYVLDERGINVVAFTREDGTKAIGMFGGIGDGRWISSGFVTWDADPETDFSTIECGHEFELCTHYAWVHFPEAEGTHIGTADWIAGVRS